MDEKTQINYYNKFLNEYIAENKLWTNTEIRDDLKYFSMKIKSILKVCLMEASKDYINEKPYMISLCYLYQYSGSFFWTVLHTDTEFKKILEKTSKIEEYQKNPHTIYFKYSAEDSEIWSLGNYAYDIFNEDYKNMVERQEFIDDYDDDEVTFWDADEFTDFYEELQETIYKSIEDLKKENFLKEINLKDILFNFYVRYGHSKEEEIKIFNRLNFQNKDACLEFLKSFD